MLAFLGYCIISFAITVILAGIFTPQGGTPPQDTTRNKESTNAPY